MATRYRSGYYDIRRPDLAVRTDYEDREVAADDTPAEVSKNPFGACWVRVNCPLRGFESVSVEVNVFASQGDIDLVKSSKSRNRKLIMRDIEGWPDGYDPWDETNTPIIFRTWLNNDSWLAARKQYLDDPNSSTA